MNRKMPNIGLVGMPNAGKTYQAKGLEALGYTVIDIDELIARDLKPRLEKEGLTTSIDDVALWMGWPYEERSPANQMLYLAFEEKAMRETLESLGDVPTVVATTGSFPHLLRRTRQRLREKTLVGYLGSSSTDEQVPADFFAQRKPIVWGEYFSRFPHENPWLAQHRCYPILRAARIQIYEETAHLSIPYEIHRSPVFTAQNLLDLVWQAAAAAR